MDTTKAQQIEQELKRLIGEFETAVQKAGSDGAAAARDARQRLSAAVDDARVRLGELDTRVRESARYAARYTDDYVHDRPWQVIGAGVLLGLLVGLLIARSR